MTVILHHFVSTEKQHVFDVTRIEEQGNKLLLFIKNKTEPEAYENVLTFSGIPATWKDAF